jgi:hypothetical protein
MKTSFRLTLTMLTLSALCATAGDFYPLPSTNAIVLNFASGIPMEVEQSIREDFQRCLTASTTEIEFYHLDRDPTNNMSLAGFWQPFADFAATSRLGVDLPVNGILSNGVFRIDVSYAFATNYQHHIESTAAYSNEIAAAYTFIESLSPTNLNIMTTNELLSLDLWKEVPPGQHPISEEDLARVIRNIRTTKYFPPPRFAFSIWECGPTNSPPYLWCFAPSLDRRNSASSEIMIFFQNRWWFTEWFLHQGEQQW